MEICGGATILQGSFSQKVQKLKKIINQMSIFEGYISLHYTFSSHFYRNVNIKNKQKNIFLNFNVIILYLHQPKEKNIQK